MKTDRWCVETDGLFCGCEHNLTVYDKCHVIIC